MVDLSDKGSSESEDMSSQTPEMEAISGGGGSSNQVKTCADCGTTKTPLWRGGPAGPKSLCNACGIRSRKRRRALLGLSKKTSTDDQKVKEPIINGEDQKIESISGKKSGKLEDSMKRKIVALGDEVVFQRSTMDKFRKKLGEEEQAAVLLMALSCGSFYA